MLNEPKRSKIVLGVDVGGTYTDVFFLNEIDGSCDTAKVPSTRADQSISNARQRNGKKDSC